MNIANYSAGVSIFAILIPLVNVTHAQLTPNEILMKSKKLTCTFTSQQNTRWGSDGPIRNAGPIKETFVFHSINHKTKTAVRPWDEDEDISVRIRDFSFSISFFELSESGEIDPVVTTVLDDYASETKEFIAIRSSHITSAFRRAIARQRLGTCVPDE